jgi:hypothetical protein
MQIIDYNVVMNIEGDWNCLDNPKNVKNVSKN